MRQQFVPRGDPAVPARQPRGPDWRFGRQNIARRIADQRDRRSLPDPALPLRMPDGQPREPRPIARHLRECAEARNSPSARSAPACATRSASDSPVARASRNALFPQPVEQAPRSRGTALSGQVRTAACTYSERLRLLDDRRKRAPYLRRGRAGVAHHAGQDIGIEHAVHRNMLGGRLETRDVAHRVDQRLPVVRSRAPDQRAVDSRTAPGLARVSVNFLSWVMRSTPIE